jgi:hypothetical protein
MALRTYEALKYYRQAPYKQKAIFWPVPPSAPRFFCLFLAYLQVKSRKWHVSWNCHDNHSWNWCPSWICQMYSMSIMDLTDVHSRIWQMYSMSIMDLTDIQYVNHGFDRCTVCQSWIWQMYSMSSMDFSDVYSMSIMGEQVHDKQASNHWD